MSDSTAGNLLAPAISDGDTASTVAVFDNVTGNVVINIPDLNTDQSSVIVVLAFISGASFIFLVLIIFLFLFCRRRTLGEEDSISNTSIVYNIEQDSVSITPSLHRQIQEILLTDDITGLLEPSLTALKAAHKMMGEMVTIKLVLTNMKHLDMLRKSIHNIPVLCDAAIQALITAEINPIEVEARMIALGLGLENTLGLLQIFEGNENANCVCCMRDFEKQLEVIKSRTEKWISNNSRELVIDVV